MSIEMVEILKLGIQYNYKDEWRFLHYNYDVIELFTFSHT
jgi:hypothetical protein